jgi:hypothetical protein
MAVKSVIYALPIPLINISPIYNIKERYFLLNEISQKWVNAGLFSLVIMLEFILCISVILPLALIAYPGSWS